MIFPCRDFPASEATDQVISGCWSNLNALSEANVRRKLKDNAQSFDLVTDKPGNLYIYVYTLLHVCMCIYIEREREIGGEGEIFRWIYIDFIKIDEDNEADPILESFLDKEFGS